MTVSLQDRCAESWAGTGTTSPITLGGALTGYRTFTSAVSNGATVHYTIQMGSEWEVGQGTFTTSGTTLSRDVIYASSNSNNIVNFSAGTKLVFLTFSANLASKIEAIIGTQILSGQIGPTHLASGSVLSGHIASGQIGQFHIAPNSITSGHIASGATQSGTLRGIHIQSGSIQAGQIGDFSVGSNHIQSGSVGFAKLQSGGTLERHIASGQIQTRHLASGLVASRA